MVSGECCVVLLLIRLLETCRGLSFYLTPLGNLRTWHGKFRKYSSLACSSVLLPVSRKRDHGSHLEPANPGLQVTSATAPDFRSPVRSHWFQVDKMWLRFWGPCDKVSLHPHVRITVIVMFTLKLGLMPLLVDTHEAQSPSPIPSYTRTDMLTHIPVCRHEHTCIFADICACTFSHSCLHLHALKKTCIHFLGVTFSLFLTSTCTLSNSTHPNLNLSFCSFVSLTIHPFWLPQLPPPWILPLLLKSLWKS